ncbi:MAG: N4-gp56 family major capsid protein [Gallionella sp.]|jgi:N4-gp56 family major capsid protein
MASATYASPAQRIGRIKGQILKHAIHSSTVEISGEVYTQPVKQGDTVTFRQVVPFGATAAAPNTFSTTAAAHLVQEGSTPPAESLVILDTEVQVQKYGALYGYTEKTESLGEDDIPSWMEEQLGERLGLVRELVYIGALQGGTNRFYSGGTTRLTTDEPVTLNLVNRVTRSLAANHGKFVRAATSSSGNYGTVALQKTYLCFGNTDMQQDIEKIPGYKAVSDYGKMAVAHEMEVGCVGSLRFILSPDMPKIIDSGAAIAGTDNLSTTGTSADIYQLFVVAKDAWGHTAFRGLSAFKYNNIKPSQVDKSDPTGERGYCSATFYDAGVVTNHGWLAVCEVTVGALGQ